MKLYNKILFGVMACLLLASCDNYLDVNKNPNIPVSEDIKYYQRLPWVEAYMDHVYDFTLGGGAVHYTGKFWGSSARRVGASVWDISRGGDGRASTAQQWCYTCVLPNCLPLYKDAMAVGAYHYAGVAKFIRAYGFMLLTDFFDAIPYSDAFTDNATPSYDSGETVYMGCIADIEEAIELLSKAQASGAEVKSLAEGDFWNNGDATKWVKACYLLKARWLNKLNKKAAGSYKEGKFDADEILACLEKAPKSNEESTVIHHTDVLKNDDHLWGEPTDWNGVHSTWGGNGGRDVVSKMFYDNLTNFDGQGIEDPRADKFIPWAMSAKSAGSPAEIKFVVTDDATPISWRRGMGVDIQTRNVGSGTAEDPYALSYKDGKWFCDTKNADRKGDTIYVDNGGSSTGAEKAKDILRHANKDEFEGSTMTGVFYERSTVPSYVATYTEACFIKAEVLFNQGNTAEAFKAYQEGVKSSIEAVNEQLKVWQGNGDEVPTYAKKCPSFTVIDAQDITDFVENGPLGSDGDLTLAKIMTQKQIAMPASIENWNDMRRYDFDPNVFMGFDKPYYYKNSATCKKYIPDGSVPRRIKAASYELNFNSAQLSASGKFVPEAASLGAGWYNNDRVWSLPVWWDRAE